jgi:hypothetical protein
MRKAEKAMKLGTSSVVKSEVNFSRTIQSFRNTIAKLMPQFSIL